MEGEALNAPKPVPGWICTAKIDQQHAEPDPANMEFTRGPGGMAFGIGKAPPEVVSAYVVAIGDYDEDYYSARPDEEPLVVPYKIGSKVYFHAHHGLEINGYLFIQYNIVVAWEDE